MLQHDVIKVSSINTIAQSVHLLRYRIHLTLTIDVYNTILYNFVVRYTRSLFIVFVWNVILKTYYACSLQLLQHVEYVLFR